jgi:hypothetical protein
MTPSDHEILDEWFFDITPEELRSAIAERWADYAGDGTYVPDRPFDLMATALTHGKMKIADQTFRMQTAREKAFRNPLIAHNPISRRRKELLGIL